MTFMILLLSGIEIVSIGILGEYISRIYQQSKMRPHFIIEEGNIPLLPKQQSSASSDPSSP